jgi:hypothetical protein
MYSVSVCNVSSATATLFPDFAVAELRKQYAVQGGKAVVYAAAHAKKNGVKVLLLTGAEIALPLALGWGAGRSATVAGRLLAGAGGGVVIGQRIAARKDEAAKLDVPEHWWLEGSPRLDLAPKDCLPMVVAIAGKAPNVIEPILFGALISPPAINETGVQSELARPTVDEVMPVIAWLTGGGRIPELRAPLTIMSPARNTIVQRTHPQVDLPQPTRVEVTPDAAQVETQIEDYRFRLIVAVAHERTARMGAAE